MTLESKSNARKEAEKAQQKANEVRQQAKENEAKLNKKAIEETIQNIINEANRQLRSSPEYEAILNTLQSEEMKVLIQDVKNSWKQPQAKHRIQPPTIYGSDFTRTTTDSKYRRLHASGRLFDINQDWWAYVTEADYDQVVKNSLKAGGNLYIDGSTDTRHEYVEGRGDDPGYGYDVDMTKRFSLSTRYDFKSNGVAIEYSGHNFSNIDELTTFMVDVEKW